MIVIHPVELRGRAEALDAEGGMNRTTVTIRDVAAHAGCSIATVSRVATGHGPVSDTLRKRIIASALQLGFRLERPANSSRRVICVLLPSLTNPVFAAALSGIEKCARANGLSTIMAQSNYDMAQEEAVVAALIAERPVGLILTVCDPEASTVLLGVARQGLPAATIYNSVAPAGIGSVSVDNRKAMALLVSELIALGHRAVLFVAGRFVSSDRSAGRYQGYCDAICAAGYAPLPAFQVDFIDATHDIDLTSVMAEQRPTAIVASNDLLAVTVIASLRRLGLSVPGDVSVTGFDGIEVAGHMSPKLTTMSQPSHTMGVLAASLVLDIAAGHRKPESLLADVTYVPGETIAPPKRQGRVTPSQSRQPTPATGAFRS